MILVLLGKLCSMHSRLRSREDDRDWTMWVLGLLVAIAGAMAIAFIVAGLLFALIFGSVPAASRDDGRYAQSPLREWMKSLKDKLGVSCCDEADGEEVEGWAFGENGYRVKVKGEWLDVPPSALLNIPNLLGFARAWLFYENGKAKVRCFLPGAGG